MIRSERALICHKCHALHPPNAISAPTNAARPSMSRVRSVTGVRQFSRPNLAGSCVRLIERDDLYRGAADFFEEPVQDRPLEENLPSGACALAEDHM